jgi:hypothetical protein
MSDEQEMSEGERWLLKSTLIALAALAVPTICVLALLWLMSTASGPWGPVRLF